MSRSVIAKIFNFKVTTNLGKKQSPICKQSSSFLFAAHFRMSSGLRAHQWIPKSHTKKDKMYVNLTSTV